MYRSILFNCWIALFAFTVYFIYTIYQSNGMAAPIETIVWSLLWAVVGFFVAFAIRAVIDYVMYTPAHIDLDDDGETTDISNEQAEHNNLKDLSNGKVNSSTVEFQDENSEEIAQVVRTMMSNEEPFLEK